MKSRLEIKTDKWTRVYKENENNEIEYKHIPYNENESIETNNTRLNKDLISFDKQAAKEKNQTNVKSFKRELPEPDNPTEAQIKEWQRSFNKVMSRKIKTSRDKPKEIERKDMDEALQFIKSVPEICNVLHLKRATFYENERKGNYNKIFRIKNTCVKNSRSLERIVDKVWWNDKTRISEKDKSNYASHTSPDSCYKVKGN